MIPKSCIWRTISNQLCHDPCRSSCIETCSDTRLGRGRIGERSEVKVDIMKQSTPSVNGRDTRTTDADYPPIGRIMVEAPAFDSLLAGDTISGGLRG